MSHNSVADKNPEAELGINEFLNSQESKQPRPSSPPILTPQKKPHQFQSAEKLQKTEESVRILKFEGPLQLSGSKKVNLYTGCNCTKSQCLKMYCTCFAEGKMCDQTCLCECCRNKTENPARSNAIVEIISRDHLAFSRKADQYDQPDSSCNCLRSNCLKKYCDCFRRGKICGPQCNCRHCQNTEEGNQGMKLKKKVKLQ